MTLAGWRAPWSACATPHARSPTTAAFYVVLRRRTTATHRYAELPAWMLLQLHR